MKYLLFATLLLTGCWKQELPKPVTIHIDRYADGTISVQLTSYTHQEMITGKKSEDGCSPPVTIRVTKEPIGKGDEPWSRSSTHTLCGELTYEVMQ